MTSFYDQLVQNDTGAAPAELASTPVAPTPAPAAPATFYDQLVQRDQEEGRLRASVQQAGQVTPEKAAQHQYLSKVTGLAPGLIESNEGEATAAAKFQEILEQSRTSPVLRAKLQDPTFTALAQDDVGPLSQIEKGIRELMRPNDPNFKRGATATGKFLVDSGKQLLMGGTVGVGAAIADTAGLVLDQIGQIGIGGMDSFGRAATTFRQNAETARASMKYFSDPTSGNIEAGIQSGMQSAGQNLVMLPAGVELAAMKGAAWAGQALAGLFGVTTGAQAYTQAREKGMAPTGSLTYAIPHGVFEYAFESIPASKLLGDIVKHSSIGTMVAHQIIPEMLGEQATTVLQDLNEWVRLNPEKTLKEFIAERPDAAIQTAVATLVGIGVQSGTVRAIQRSIGGVAEDEARAQDADQYAQRMQQLLQLAAGSKLRERDPEGFTAFAQQAAQEAGFDGKAHVEGSVLAEALQQAGITPKAFAQMSPQAGAELAAAAQSGGTVAIPVGDLVGSLAQTGLEQALLPHLRMTEESLSQEEAKVVTQQAQQMLHQEATRLMGQVAEVQAVQASAEVVKNQLLDQLATANRFTADVNQAYAALASSFYTATAARYGITPEEMYARYPLRIQATTGSDLAFGQGRTVQVDGVRYPDTDSSGHPIHTTFQGQANFWRTFRGTKAVNEAGQPMVLYHGTAGDITAFDRGQAGKTTGAANAKEGFFLVDRPGIANTYARIAGSEGANVMPVYANLQNPMQATAPNMLEADKLMTNLPAEYDGAIVQVGEGDARQTVYMVRNAAQIKSALGNNGQFDAGDPDVLSQSARYQEALLAGRKLEDLSSEERAQYDVLEQPAYHGSPHNFDKFSTDAIGTGEGAQAFGWGLYFAENPAIATGYHRALAEDPEIQEFKVGRFPVIRKGEFLSYSPRDNTALENVKATIIESLLIDEHELRAAQNAGTLDKFVMDKIEGFIDGYYDPVADKELIAAAKQFKKSVETSGVTFKLGATTGGVYQVDIHDDVVAKMLLWDKPLSEQPESVRQAIAARGALLNRTGQDMVPMDPSGEEIYHALANAEGNDAEASKWLDAAGVPGVKYLDGGSRNRILKDIKREFLAELPENADFDEVLGLIGDGTFSPANEAIIQALAADDWLGFDYPAQALSAALGGRLASDYPDVSTALLKAVDDAQIEQPTHNLVVFNDANVTLTHKDGTPVTQAERDAFLQTPTEVDQGTGTRGTFSPTTLTITLLEKADLSTFLHETGHFFLEAMADMASQQDAPADLATDMQTVLEWFGVRDLATWRGMTLSEQRANHEKFAESFEQYLFEGKAPSRELQSLFGRFRAWLTNVYRSLQQFMGSYNTQLSDEVRAVFDRLLATQDQIDEANATRGFTPLFESIADSGMDMAAWEKYQATNREAVEDAMSQLQARSMRDLRWVVNARSRELTKISKDAEEKRDAIKAEVTAEVDATPEMQAVAFLEELSKADPALVDARKDWRDRREAAEERATETVKAGYAELAEAQGLKGLAKGQFFAKSKRQMDHDVAGQMLKWEQENPRPRKMPVDVDLDMISERFGFTSGDHMLKAIDAYGSRHHAIEGITGQRMLERYGDLATPEGQKRAAEEAIHNEARARAIATELAALQAGTTMMVDSGRKTKDGKPIKTNGMLAAAKQFASQLVSNRKVKDLKPAQHLAAETRAAKRATEASKKGDTQLAMTAKRDQLLNFYAAKETTAALEEIEKGVKYLRKVASSETLDAGYAEQIDTLLERFNLKNTSAKARDRSATLLEWVESQREMGIEPNVPPELLDEARRKPYQEMTVEEFRGLLDTIKQIEHLGRLKHKLLTAKDQREYAEVVARIVKGIVDNADGRQADTRTPNTVLGEKLLKLQSFAAMHIKTATWARVMDGGKDGGMVWEYIIRAANDAGNKEVVMREQATRELAELVAPILKTGKMGGKGIFIPLIKRSLNREARLAIALNTGNASNIQRLMGGENWTQAQVDAILSTITADEWRFVQKTWDFFESFRPEIAAKERRVNGVEPKWLEAVGRVVQSADGKAVTLRGGYYPVKYDPRASERAESHAEAEARKEGVRAAYTSATTRRSFTKDRAEAVNGRPLLYSLDGIYRGINEVIHDLSWHEFLIDANRLIKNESISGAMRQKYGAEAHQQFKSWLQDVAAGEQNAANEGFAGWVRQGVSIAGLGFNVMSAAIQPLGITQSVERIGAKWVGRGVQRFAAAPLETTDMVHGKSEFMRTRALTRLREMAEVRSNIKGRSKFREGVDTGAYFLMLRAQQLVDIPTWVGAYEKAVVEGGNDESRAVALADQAVIDSQGSGGVKDQAAIERGNQAMKLFTVFYSFFNTALNAGVRATMTEDSKATLASKYLLLFVVPVVLGALLKDALTAGDSGDWDDPKKIAKKLAREELSYLFGLMVGVREFAGAAQVVTGTNEFNNDYSGPAGVRPIGDMVKLAKQVHQGEMDDGLRKAIINTAGELLRLPSAQINRSITGAKALSDGKTQNPLALVTGYQEPHN